MQSYQLILRGFFLFFGKQCTLNSDQRSVFFYVFSGFFFLGFQCVVHIWAEEQNWPHFSKFKVLHFGIKLFFFSYLWMFPEFNSRPFLFPFCVFSLNQLWLMVLTFSSMLMALLFTELLFIIWLGSKRLV